MFVNTAYGPIYGDATQMVTDGWHRPPGAPLVALWRHHPRRDTDAAGLASASLDFARRSAGDLIKLPASSTWQATAFGLRDIWRPDPLGRRHICHHPVAMPGDWDRLALCAAQFDRREVVTLDALARVAAGRDRPVPVLATVFAPATVAAQLVPAMALGPHLAAAPLAVAGALRVIADRTCRLIAACAEAGADGIYLAVKHRGAGAWPLPDGQAGEMLRSAVDAADAQVMAAASALPHPMLHLHASGLSGPIPAAGRRWMVHMEQDVAAELDAGDLCGHLPAIGLDLDLVQAGGAPLHVMVDQLKTRIGGDGLLLSAACVLPLSVGGRDAARLVARLRRVAA